MLVGVVGLIGSGKNTAGDVLVERYGYRRDSFARTLKDVTAALFNWDRELLEGDTEASREYRETVDRRWSDMLGFDITPRYALQYLGTEVFRDNLHSEIWLHTVKNRYEENGYAKTVITDVRFPNEMQFIRSQGGQILFVERGERPEYWYEARVNPGQMTIDYPNVHKSEWAWVAELGIRDYKINNDGDLDSFKNELDKFQSFMNQTRK